MQTKHINGQAVDIEISEHTIEQIIEQQVAECTIWACKNRPRLVHLAGYAKKGRSRTKSARRIIREYYGEG